MKKTALGRNRRFLARGVMASALVASLALTGCAGGTFEEETAETAAEKTEQKAEADGSGSSDWDGDWVSLIDIPGMDFEYSDRDKDASYDAATATTIALSGTGATVTGDGASVDGSTVTISAAGTYVVSGELAGELVVEATSEDKVQVVLNGATIRNTSGAALNVQQADKVFVTLAPGSQNMLADGSSYALADGEDEPNAALFSKDDLTINGTGALTVEGNYRHAVNSKDDLVITGGTLTVKAVVDGLRGKDCVKIADGTFAITAGEDGVKSSNDSDPTRGFVSIDGGTFTVDAGDEGFQAATYLRLTGGKADVKAGDHALRSDVEAAMTGGDFTVAAEGKGMNPETKFTMDGGTLDVTKCEEGIEAQEIIINDGELSIVASDDGLNAAIAERDSNDATTSTAAVSSDATADASGDRPAAPNGEMGEPPAMPDGEMSEGMEEPPAPPTGEQAAAPENTDGTENADSYGRRGNRQRPGSGAFDGTQGERPEMPEGMEPGQRPDGTQDGSGGFGGPGGMGGQRPDGDFGDFGGMGGGMMGGNASADCLIQINGGTVTIDAGGDAVDSNGYIEVTGGTLLGASSGQGDSALDYELGATVSGGTVILAGAAGMAESFSADSTQPFALVNASGRAGSNIGVTDSAGTTLASFTATEAFQCVLVSAPGLAEGDAITITVDGAPVQATASTIPTSGMGGMGGRGGQRF